MSGAPPCPEVSAASVQSVVAEHLCTGCGTCVAVCPDGAVSMRETPAGLLEAQVSVLACSACGLCLTVCAGRGMDLELPQGVDPLRGRVLGAYRGFATDPTIRARGQSGGIVTALLAQLLDSRLAEEAVVTDMPADGSLRARARRVHTVASVRDAAGSKYQPVAVNAALRSDGSDARTAAVCLGCHAHGVRLLQRRRPQLAERISPIIGLFCDRTLMATAADVMCRAAGLPRDVIQAVEYRSTERCGWPGEVAFDMQSGERLFYPASLRLEIKDFLTPPRCRLCFDKFNVLSDVAVGDPWGLDDPASDGESVVLVRTEEGRRLVDAARAAGVVELRPVDSDAVFTGQAVERRRSMVAAAQAAWRWLGGRPPTFTSCGMPILPEAEAREAMRAYLALRRNLATAQSLTPGDVSRRVSEQRRWGQRRHEARAALVKVKHLSRWRHGL